MGVRCTIKFFEEWSEIPIAGLGYKYVGGYISRVGYDLAEWLNTKTLVESVTNYMTETMENGYAAGMSCLAAQYIKEHKIEIDGLYLTNHVETQDYNYEVRFIEGTFQIKINDEFIGTPDELLEFIAKMENI